jgi:hypothetical protein
MMQAEGRSNQNMKEVCVHVTRMLSKEDKTSSLTVSLATA